MIDLKEQLREAVRRSGLNRKQLAERAGVGYASVWAFMDGSRDLTLASVEKLAPVVGIAGFKLERGRKPAVKKKGAGHGKHIE